MSHADIFLTVLVGTIAIGGCAMLPKLIEDVVSAVQVHRFARDIRAAIKFCQPTWSEVCDLAKTAGVTDRTAYDIACRIRHSIMTGGEDQNGVADHRALVDGWIAEYRRKEPFEGLPDSMRVSLERLGADLGTNTDALQRVTADIRELVKSRSLESTIVKWITYAGLPIAIGGCAFAVWSYLHPFTPSA
jgi:hypothetical protein